MPGVVRQSVSANNQSVSVATLVWISLALAALTGWVLATQPTVVPAHRPRRQALTVADSRQARWFARPHSHSPVALVPQYTCIAWRQTRDCNPFAAPEPLHDGTCFATITAGQSGFCECSRNITVQRRYCGGEEPAFTCKEECQKLNDPQTWRVRNSMHGPLALPPSVQCPPAGAKARFPGSLGLGRYSGLMPGISAIRVLDKQAETLWRGIAAAVQQADNAVDKIQPQHQEPLSRLTKREVGRMQTKWTTLMRHAPPYPEGMFGKRGIVVVSGGPTFFVPSWVLIITLRRTGCVLPVEMFFLPDELPGEELQEALEQLGVTCRAFDLHDIPWYALKPAAILLSRFQQVLFLDADNVLLTDPTPLFDCDAFKDNSAVFWQDFWTVGSELGGNLRHSQLHQILEMEAEDLPVNTFDGGQMLWDKARAWDALLLALFFCIKGHEDHAFDLFLYPMGAGDKEIYPIVALKTQTPIWIVPYAPIAVGLLKQDMLDGEEQMKLHVMPHTLGQHDLRGQLMFLHTSFAKFRLPVVGDWAAYKMQWQAWTTHALAVDIKGMFPPPTFSGILDLEKFIYEALVELTCSDFFRRYALHHRIPLQNSERTLSASNLVK